MSDSEKSWYSYSHIVLRELCACPTNQGWIVRFPFPLIKTLVKKSQEHPSSHVHKVSNWQISDSEKNDIGNNGLKHATGQHLLQYSGVRQ